MNTEKITQELDAMSERINAIKAEINKPEKVEPKEGEWWYSGNGNPAICRVKNIDGGCVYYYEVYFSYCHRKDNFWSLSVLERPATTDEITHFMGLHADRLGYKEGVKVDRSKLGSGWCEVVLTGKGEYDRLNNWFIINGKCVRDSQGTWAEVVKDEKVVVNGVEIIYGTIGESVNINGAWLNKDQVQFIYDLTNSPELKTILDGFKKQK